MKTKRKISPPTISPFSCPKLGEDKEKGCKSDFVRFCAQTFFLAQITNGGRGACRNFAYYSMLIILY